MNNLFYKTFFNLFSGGTFRRPTFPSCPAIQSLTPPPFPSLLLPQPPLPPPPPPALPPHTLPPPPPFLPCPHSLLPLSSSPSSPSSPPPPLSSLPQPYPLLPPLPTMFTTSTTTSPEAFTSDETSLLFLMAPPCGAEGGFGATTRPRRPPPPRPSLRPGGALTGVAGQVWALCYLYGSTRRQNARTVFYVLLCTLVWLHLLGKILTTPPAIISYAYGTWVGGKHMCDFHGFSMVLVCTLTHFTLAAMAVERFLGICHGYFYSRNVTPHRCSSPIPNALRVQSSLVDSGLYPSLAGSKTDSYLRERAWSGVGGLGLGGIALSINKVYRQRVKGECSRVSNALTKAMTVNLMLAGQLPFSFLC
ncbi:putative prostaglandin E2 receptor EP4 subtype-like [Penaeus vannamei]|uniref:Putative prostaglandin E2 receptor EP4 subtype-like n=1 Tax=Penaeus vannamei TaxID=6689 RepID=A0A3R7QAW2_PENVA|nr:putative prostaglandin E2 receptor EP4 subtype-like [Penaeus vannamei]